MQCTLGSLNLTFDLQSSKRDEWEREALAQRCTRVLEMSRGLPKGRPISIYKHPKQIEPLYPFTGCFSGRPDAPVETDRTRCTASDRPASFTCSPEFNCDRSNLQRSLCANGQTQSTGRAAQMTGRADRTAPRAREASTGRAPDNDRT
jgi:hypothetical protein